MGTIVSGFPGMTYEDETRLQGIVGRLKNATADLVTLEEVWGTKSSTPIVNELATSPFAFTANDGIDSPLKMGSGLLLLSRHPLKSGQFIDPVVTIPQFTEFEQTAMPDGLANKGFITVQVNPMSGPKFWIIHTHTQADYDPASVKARQANIRQIADRVDLLHKTFAEPVVVVGDLNVVGETESGLPTDEYETMTKRFGDSGLVDAYRTLHPDVKTNPAFTYDGTKNRLISIFAPKDNKTRQRLDYVFLDAKNGVSPVQADVVSDFTYTDSKTSQTTDLSDHYPISVEFTVG